MAENNSDRPIGQRYSRVYLDPKPISDDSGRARSRIGYFLEGRLDTHSNSTLAKKCRETFGHGPKSVHSYVNYEWQTFLTEIPIDEVLDLVTIAQAVLSTKAVDMTISLESRQRVQAVKKEWIPFCREVCAEEGLGYRIDDAGGVHPLVDEEFQLAKQSLLVALDSPRFAGAKKCYEDAHRHFGSRPPDRKAAIRSMFECVETLFQLQAGNAKLNRGNIENKFVPLLRKTNAADDPETQKAIGASLAKWTDAFHRYRHGQGEQEPRDPSVQLTVFALSSGASFARLIAELQLPAGTS